MMKMTNRMMFLLAAVTLLMAGWVGAADPDPVLSDVVSLDTRTLSRVVAEEDKPLDSRSYTVDWSVAGLLNTKRIIGTILLFK